MLMSGSTLVGFAVAGFMLAFVALLLMMVLVQPLWCIVDCAVDDRRSSGSKVFWIIALVLLYGLANWFYGAFAASGPWLRRLTRIAWVVAILLIIAFSVAYFSSLEFRRGIDLEWRQRRPTMVMVVPFAVGLEVTSGRC